MTQTEKEGEKGKAGKERVERKVQYMCTYIVQYIARPPLIQRDKVAKT
jgi:hypothetical protein